MSRILTTAPQQKVVQFFFNGEKVLEMITVQALKVSNDFVKVVYIVSQVPWNHPITYAVISSYWIILFHKDF